MPRVREALVTAGRSRFDEVFLTRARSRRQRVAAAWRVVESSVGPISPSDQSVFRRYCTGRTRRSCRNDIARVKIAFGAGVAATACLLGFVLILWVRFGPPENSPSATFLLVVSMITEYILAAVLVAFGYLKSTFALGVALAVSSAVCIRRAHESLFGLPSKISLKTSLEFGLLYGSLSLIFLAAVVLVCVYLYMTWYTRRLTKEAPEDIVLTYIFEALRILSEGPLRFSDPALRSELASGSHRSAIVFERFMTKRTGVLDPVQLRTVNLRMRQAGARMREFESWLSLPQLETRRVLITKMSLMTLSLATGRYHDLPTPDVAIDARDRSWNATVAHVFKSLLVGFTPILTFWLFNLTGAKLAGEPWDIVKLACFLWTCVSLLMLFDPLYAAKVTNVKDLVGVLQSVTELFRKGKE
jgi:hypothetical protein